MWALQFGDGAMVQACPAEHAIHCHSYICADFLAQSGNCLIVLVVIFVLGSWCSLAPELFYWLVLVVPLGRFMFIILAFWHFGISALMCLAIRYHLACQMYQTWGLCWGSVCLTHLPYECYGYAKRTHCLSVCAGHIYCSHPQCPITSRYVNHSWIRMVLPGQVPWYYILLLVHSAHYVLLFSYGDYEC